MEDADAVDRIPVADVEIGAQQSLVHRPNVRGGKAGEGRYRRTGVPGRNILRRQLCGDGVKAGRFDDNRRTGKAISPREKWGRWSAGYP